MGKILLLIILAAIVLAWFRARARSVDKPDSAAPAARAAAQVAPEQMVTCLQCGLNLPAGEAVFDDRGGAFCGAEHLQSERARQKR